MIWDVFKILGDFGHILEEIVFLKGLVKFGKIKKILKIYVVLKLEFELKISRWTPKPSPANQECPYVRGVTVRLCSKNNFHPLLPSLHLLESHLISCVEWIIYDK